MPAAEAAAPISVSEARKLFADLAAAPALVLAVSGGPDSTALLVLMARWRAALRRGPKLLAHVCVGVRGDKPDRNGRGAARGKSRMHERSPAPASTAVVERKATPGLAIDAAGTAINRRLGLTLYCWAYPASSMRRP